MSFEDFRNAWMNQQVSVGSDAKGNMKTMEAGKWWLNHPMRRQYKTIVFAPGEETTDAYNLWQGFGFTAMPGMGHESFLQHVRDNVCEGNEDYYRYLLGWMARVVQRPSEPGEVAIVLRGGKGVGKSFFAKQFGKLFGRHFLEISNPLHLVGNFNSHLRDALLLFADEAFYAGDKKQAQILKTLITSDTLTIEAKGIDAENAPNFVHLIMASNDDHVVQASEDERRFFVLNVGSEQRQQSSYFGSIAADLNNGGYENLLHFLLNHNLSDFEVRRVPQTSALQEQKLQTAESWMSQIVQMAETGITPDHDAWKPETLQSARDPGWVSVTGILEAAKLDPAKRSYQMAVSKALDPLLERAGKDKICRTVHVRCIAESGKPSIPFKGNQVPLSLPVRKIQRRMYKLLPLEAVRFRLRGFVANWEEGIATWILSGDEF
jgi:hypothetical protein